MWSKVIAAVIAPILVAVTRLLIGRKKADEYDFFKIINVKLPAWQSLLSILIFLAAISLFPLQGVAITVALLVIIVGLSIRLFRKVGFLPAAGGVQDGGGRRTGKSTGSRLHF